MCQASLTFAISLKFMSIESVIPSNHLILCCSFLLPLIFPSIRVLWFHTNFKIFFFYVVKNAVGILRGIPLNLYIALGIMDILTISILLIHEHRLAFCLFVPLLIFSSVPYSFHCIDLSHPWLNLFLSTLLFLMLSSLGLFS